MRYDVAVLGAGPAGAVAALVAARAGMRVALIDKARFPRNKLCGGLLTGRTIRHLQELGIALPAETVTRHERMSFYRCGDPLGTITGCPPVWLTTRLALDDLLLRAALATGADDLTGQRIDAIEPSTLLMASGERIGFSVLIGADGVKSVLARHLFGQSFDPARIGFALEIENPPVETASIRIDFGAAEWGYGWLFPKPGSTTIGLGGVHRRNPQMKDRLSDYLDLLGLPCDAQVKGHFLPFGDFRPVPGRGNMLLAGDAAGLVDPITGEGIGHAIHSGALAARAACDAVRDGDPGRALTKYQAALAPLHRGLTYANWLRPLVFSKTTGNFFAKAFRGSTTAKHRYMQLLAGETDYPAFLRLTLSRLPSRLLSRAP